MSTFLNANDALSTLAGSINNVAVTANLAIGTGALFPSPGAGQYFVGTFIAANNPATKEIVHVTSRTGDTITIVRAQEGTSALSWTAGDAFQQRWTAGQAQALLQVGQSQSQSSNYALDTGTTNAYVVTLSPALASPVLGMPIRFKVANAPTGASTLNPGPGAAALRRANGTAFIGGEWVVGEIVEVFWNGTQYQWNGLAIASAAAITAGTDVGSAVSPAQLADAVTPPSDPTVQVFTAAGAFTYTPTIADVKSLWVRYVGGGGGGGGTGASTGPNGSTGGDTIFNSVHAKGGGGGDGNATGSSLPPSAAGAGGTGGSGSASLRIPGQRGGVQSFVNGNGGGPGGSSPFFGGGAQSFTFNLPAGGLDGEPNTGGGGGGSFSQTSTQAAAGGGSGEYVELWLTAPVATYTGTVGVGGAGGIGTGTNGQTGGAGADGQVIVVEFYKAT